MYHHKIDFTMFEDMMPWERSVYIKLLTDTVQAENERIRLENAAKKAKQKLGLR